MKKYYSILISLLAVGLALFLIQAAWCTVGGFWYSAVGNIASALLIGGTLSLLHQILLKVDEERKLITIFNISTAIKESGLTNMKTDSSQYHFHDLIIHSEEFIAIMNDGLRWVGNHSPALEERFNKKGTTTEFYLVNPDSDFCKALALKTSTELVFLQEKILQTIGLLESTYNKSSRSGVLKIYLIKNYPTQSIFYTENTVVVTPYQTSSGRNTIPLYEYHYKKGVNSIGQHLHNDLQNVRQESQLISENGQRQN